MFPLAVMRCGRCGLVQLTVVVAPEVMFRDYLYLSSASSPMISHFAGLASELRERFVPADGLVVEIGSNDGILLRQLAARGASVLGVEPAENLAALANADGLRTWARFFDEGVAAEVRREVGSCAALVGCNVLAHIGDLPMIPRAADTLLAPHGVVVVEVPYLLDLLDRVEYDTIYHEHLSYFHLRPLVTLFEHAGLEVFDVRRLGIHGGSLRVFAGRPGSRTVAPSVTALLADEEARGLGEENIYRDFARKVATSAETLRALVTRLRSGGSRVAGWGATAKGNTLLSYCGLGREMLDFIADSTPYKQGLLTPGTHIPVVPESAIYAKMPDYALLLAWNYADEIMARNSEYTNSGGRFIHPIPFARVIGE